MTIATTGKVHTGTKRELHQFQEIKSVNPKGNQCWIITGQIDAEAESPILWPPDANSWLIGKDFDAMKDWRQKEKRAAEDEMVRQNHWFNVHEFEWTLGDSLEIEGREAWYAAVHGVAELDMA